MLIQLVAIVASTGGPVWKGGGKTVTVVVNEGLGSYTVNGAPGHLSIYCGGKVRSTSNNTLAASPGDPSTSSGSDMMGSYSQVSQSFGVDLEDPSSDQTAKGCLPSPSRSNKTEARAAYSALVVASIRYA
eukprot:gene17224-24209_t